MGKVEDQVEDKRVAFVKRNYHWFAGVSGVVMIAIGVLVATNVWTRMLGPVLRAIRNFAGRAPASTH